MKPPPFAYTDPQTVPEAMEVLAQYGEEAKILAGGQSLVPLLNMRLAQPQVLVDINRIAELVYIRPERRDGVSGMAIGAMTRQHAVEDHAEIARNVPLLREAIGWVGHSQIRNRGTVGGSIAHADPSAELPLTFRLLDGVATLRSARGERRVQADEFFLYTFSPDIRPDEMLVETWWPLPAPRTGQAFLEVARRHGDFALIACAATLTLDEEGRCRKTAIAVGGAAPVPARASGAEESLRGQRPALDLFRSAAEIAATEMEPTSDVHADAAYRRDVTATLVSRALTLAWERVPRDDA